MTAALCAALGACAALTSSRAALAAVGSSARAAERPHLDALVAKYASIKGYVVDITAHELRTDGTYEDRRMRVWLRKPDRAKVLVLDGPAAGSRVIWTGTSRVIVHPKVVSFLSLHFDLHDKRLISPRGNTMLAADLGSVLACFTAHRADVKEEVNASSHETTLHLHRASGVGCSGDPPIDTAVTDDVLALSAEGWPISRERFAGDTLVERWKLENLETTDTLTDDDFR